MVCRQRNLLERLSALEELYGQQMQRLKGYMPANAYTRLQVCSDSGYTSVPLVT